MRSHPNCLALITALLPLAMGCGPSSQVIFEMKQAINDLHGEVRSTQRNLELTACEPAFREGIEKLMAQCAAEFELRRSAKGQQPGRAPKAQTGSENRARHQSEPGVNTSCSPETVHSYVANWDAAHADYGVKFSEYLCRLPHQVIYALDRPTAANAIVALPAREKRLKKLLGVPPMPTTVFLLATPFTTEVATDVRLGWGLNQLEQAGVAEKALRPLPYKVPLSGSCRRLENQIGPGEPDDVQPIWFFRANCSLDLDADVGRSFTAEHATPSQAQRP